MQKNRSAQWEKERLHNYLRTHRKKAGLSQRDVAVLLAYSDDVAISRHEQSTTVPPLFAAIAYEIIFKTPVSVLFHGIRDATKSAITERLRKFEEELQTKHGKGAKATRRSQKLAWLAEHGNLEDD
jgi:transcriptional regulator with XRE-family HTH domain